MDPMECCSLKALLNYAQDTLDSTDRAAIYTHVFACKGCGEKLQLLLENLQLWQAIRRLAAEDQSFEFSEEVISAIVSWFKSASAGAQSLEISEETIVAIAAQLKQQTAAGLQPIRQFFARLIFDTGVLPEFAYERDPSNKIVRRSELFQAEGYDIDLLFIFYKTTNNERVAGQVVPEQGAAVVPTPFKVELLQQGSVISATNTNQYGFFKFTRLVADTYDLKISVPEGEINLERVQTARAM
jgi:hypothetical protein